MNYRLVGMNYRLVWNYRLVNIELSVGQYELPDSWYGIIGQLIQNYRLVGMELPVGWYELPVSMNYRLVQKYRLVSMKLPVGMELPVVLAIDREQPDVG